MRKILSLCAAMLVAFAVNADVIKIDNSSADALRLALESANDGDVIEMAAGTYVESNAGFIAFDGKAVTVQAAKGEEVILQPQVSITISGGALAHFKDIKIDAAHIHDAEGAWYEHIIYATDDNASNSLVMEGCEVYGFPLNNSVIFCGKDFKLASVTIDGCYFHNNRKSCLYFENADMASLSVTNSTFANTYIETGDADSYYAGNIFTKAELTAVDVLVDHCTFYNVNCMNTDYGAVKVKGAAPAVVSNCLFMMPASYSGGRAVYNTAGTVSYCITYNYGKDSGTGLHSGPTISNCSVADPKFVDAANGNFKLDEGSPALGAASDGTDLGDPRWNEAAPALLTEPDAAPAAPEWPANQVKAVYSATYDADCNFGEWGSGTAYTQDTYGKKYVTTNLGYFGLEFSSLNCSKMEKLNLAVWIAEDASIRIVPIWKTGGEKGPEQGITKALVGQQWNYIEIALTEFDQITDWTDIIQIKIDEARDLTFWLNNVYFSTSVAPAVDDEAPTNFTAVVESNSYFSANIKANAEDNSGAVTFDVIHGELILISANAVSGADAIITVPSLPQNSEIELKVIAKDESGNATDPIVLTVHTLEAPAPADAPTYAAADVLSVQSDVYENIAYGIQDWWSGPAVTLGNITATSQVLYIDPTGIPEGGCFGLAFGAQDITSYDALEMDVYATVAGKLDIQVIGVGDASTAYDLVAGEWNHIVLDIAGNTKNNCEQIGFYNCGRLAGGVFVQNVLFVNLPEPPAVMTVAEAYAIVDALADNATVDGDYIVEGYVTMIATAYNEGYNNVSVWIDDDADGIAKLQLYRAVPVDDASKLVTIGDKVKAIGTQFKKYVNNGNVTPELVEPSLEVVEAAPAYELSGDGTEEKPYNVADLNHMAKKDETVVWVVGYIVGAWNATRGVWENPPKSNIVLADAPDETNLVKMAAVGLKTAIRPDVNVADNPDNVGKKIWIKGKLNSYFSGWGIKDADEFHFDKASAIENVESVEAVKIMRDGQLYIIRDGKMYNVVGAEVK